MTNTAEQPNIDIGANRILHADTRKWRMVSAIGGAFMALGLFLIYKDGDFLAWFVTLFFGLVAGVGLLQLFGIGSYIELNADTFTITNFGRRTTERWDECADFATFRNGQYQLVGYDRARDIDTHMGHMNRAVSGRTAALPDTFGGSAQDLVNLLNAYQEFGVQRAWQRHAEDVETFSGMIADNLKDSGQPADVITDPAAMALPAELSPWLCILVVLKEPRLDGFRHILIAADVLSPSSRWINEEVKRTEAFDVLGADELQIIDPVTKNIRRILREAHT